MTDYKRNTGSSGQMMIRDSGGYIEFWLNSFNSTTYNYALPWGGIVNGVEFPWRYHRYEKGDGWNMVGRWLVSTSQSVTFRIGDTGTSGFGGPSSFTVSISRAAKPGAPSTPLCYILGYQKVYVTFSDGASNGSAIDARQIGYGLSSTTPSVIVASDKTTDIAANFIVGEHYFFRARCHNIHGWGPWSAAREVNLWNGAYVKYGGVWKKAVPYVRVAGVWKEARPYVKHLGIWKACP